MGDCLLLRRGGGASLPTLSNPASESEILASKEVVGADGSVKTGTMPNNGAVSKTLTKSAESYTIPAGYHNGSGKVTAPTFQAYPKSRTIKYAGEQWSVMQQICDNDAGLNRGTTLTIGMTADFYIFAEQVSGMVATKWVTTYNY